MAHELQPRIDPSTVERVILHGDLKQLSAAQKVSYYRAVCESVGLNPLTQPFQYLVLNGKEVLYARREASEQLRQLHQVSITIVARELVEDIYVVTARATLPAGRTDENIGAVPLGALKGEARANAMMKAETKAKRRVTLAICGLGLLDETEVDSLPAAAVVPRREIPAIPGPTETPEAPETTAKPAPFSGTYRIMAVDDEPTKSNPKLRKYSVTLDTGEVLTSLNSWIASLANEYREAGTPVRLKIRTTRWGPELTALIKADLLDVTPEPPPTDQEMPF